MPAGSRGHVPHDSHNTEKRRAPHFPGSRTLCRGALRFRRASPPRPCSSLTVDSPGPRSPRSPHTPPSTPRSRTLAQDPERLSVHSEGPRLSSQPHPRPHALWRSGRGLQPPPSPPGPGRPASQSRCPQGSAGRSRPWTSSDSSAPPQPGKSPPPGLTDFPHGQSECALRRGAATTRGPAPPALPLG